MQEASIKAKAGYVHETKPKPDAKNLTERKCMTCSTTFLSEGAHNRLCKSCRAQTIYDGTA